MENNKYIKSISYNRTMRTISSNIYKIGSDSEFMKREVCISLDEEVLVFINNTCKNSHNAKRSTVINEMLKEHISKLKNKKNGKK